MLIIEDAVFTVLSLSGKSSLINGIALGTIIYEIMSWPPAWLHGHLITYLQVIFTVHVYRI